MQAGSMKQKRRASQKARRFSLDSSVGRLPHDDVDIKTCRTTQAKE
jgi:hypothetical protein